MKELENLKIEQSAAAASSAGTAVNGTGVDMSGHEGVIFFSAIATANAGNYLKAQESDDNSSFADLAGTKVVAASNGQKVVLEVHKPKKRYIRAVLIRGGADTVTSDIIAVRYGGRTPPETSGDVSVTVQSPDAGTP